MCSFAADELFSARCGLSFLIVSACLSRYYPYHYAPFLSDIKNVSELKLTFELEKPFMPFQQLLAVLPAASMELLPEAYRVTALTSTSYHYNTVIMETTVSPHRRSRRYLFQYLQ